MMYTVDEVPNAQRSNNVESAAKNRAGQKTGRGIGQLIRQTEAVSVFLKLQNHKLHCLNGKKWTDGGANTPCSISWEARLTTV